MSVIWTETTCCFSSWILSSMLHLETFAPGQFDANCVPNAVPLSMLVWQNKLHVSRRKWHHVSRRKWNHVSLILGLALSSHSTSWASLIWLVEFLLNIFIIYCCNMLEWITVIPDHSNNITNPDRYYRYCWLCFLIHKFVVWFHC